MDGVKTCIKGIQPYPWYVQYRQVSQGGKLSRPRLLDAKHKPVSLLRNKHAALMAMAPLIAERLVALLQRSEMLHLQYQSACGFNVEVPRELRDAQELVKILERQWFTAAARRRDWRRGVELAASKTR